MSHFQPLILQIWKTAGQKSRLEESVTALLQLLRVPLSVEGIVIGRFRSQLGYVETLSRVFADGSQDNLHFNDCPAEKTDVFSLDQQRICSPEDEIPPLFTDLAGDDAKRCFLYWPMTRSDDVLTFFLFIGPDIKKEQQRPVEGKEAADLEPQRLGIRFCFSDHTNISEVPLPFSADETVLCHEISEMLLAAIRKESEFRHLVHQREAAEAEKQSALQKLGRKNVVEEVIGIDNGLKQVFQRLELVFRSDTTVMLLGENGTGKELIARTIHLQSHRWEKPFYRFNCGAFSQELVSMHLFGQEKKQSPEIIPGILEKVDGGTLFLDDIHELTLTAQTQLYAFLEKGEFRRNGGETLLSADVRLITATDHDLQPLVSASRFSEPLWYQLTVFPVRIPSLHERGSDMKALADHFARRAATRFGLPLVLPSEEDLVLLKNYPWPGNVRELGTVMDRAAILGNGRKLEIASALGLHHARPGKNISPWKNTRSRWSLFETIEPLDHLLKRYFEYVLKITEGKIEGKDGAAALLDIHPNTLRARMKKIGVDWKSFSSSSHDDFSTT